MSETNRERDLVLAPNEYAFISDQTKGNINVYVGPYKTSLANTDKPVIFDQNSKRFEKCNLDESTQIFITAPEGWYIVMKNPPRDGNQPKTGTTNSLAELNVGRKVNIPGPINFALWPGQMAKVIPGHQLRSNQYLLVRVYDEEEARKNWTKAVIKTKNNEDADDPTKKVEDADDLIMGKLLVIKGENVSFYIPPTGLEVVPDERKNYVREAITLERLEYCILRDENGHKRFIQGPAVVFPEPTEEFVVRDGARKFKALELNETSGLYIKVIAPYEENGVQFKEGDELFITGKDQMIYYPRSEHAIIKYGSKEKHYATAIPPGEGRYYLNRKTGTISLEVGPSMFLPDPRDFVLVRRILSPKQVSLWYPGNEEALQYNKRLQEIAQDESRDYLEDNELSASTGASFSKEDRKKREKVSEEAAGDSFNRDTGYTPPRMVTLENKYDGAVTISPWTGYALMVVSRAGTRKVILGPQTYLLEYDETLEVMELSTGTPKTTDNILRTVYLRVLHNKISDIIKAESSDFTQVSIYLSYRVNFEGDPEKWFNVENYVKFLTDHMRSFIRNTVKKYNIMEFYSKGIEILRDAILGKTSEDGKRTGRVFDENGMRIYDVEVLDIRLSDVSLENLLIASQQEVIKQTLRIAAEKRKLEFTQESESINQQIAKAQATTRQKALDLQGTEIMKELEVTLARLDSEVKSQQLQLNARLSEQDALNQINSAELQRQRASEELALEVAQRELSQYLEELKGDVEAVVAKAQAVSPNLIAALQAFADKALAEKMAESMSPLAILGGKSIAEVFANLLKGTSLARIIQAENNNENNIEE